MQKQSKYYWLLLATIGLFMCFPFSSKSQSPTAAFNQDKNVGCIPVIVNFSDVSTGNIASYYWDFGNGNNSVLQNPGATYTKAGSYNVKLVVTDVNGKKDSIEKAIAVTAFANPVASFSANKQTGCEGEVIDFTDNSVQTSNPIVSWAWNFGDGNQSGQQSPSHSFKTKGSFAVSLVITDSKGCKNAINQANYININQVPAVAFSANVTTACKVPQTVNFTDLTPAQSGKTYTYQWDFGDGGSTTQQNPSNIYKTYGDYTVSLTVTDNQNCKKTLVESDFIKIGAIRADFDLPKKTGCAPFVVSFTNSSQNVPSNARQVWHFGNGDSIVSPNPIYQYQKDGVYDITLEISTPDGCYDKIVKKNYVTVLKTPVFDFSSTDSISCKSPTTFKFSANTVGATKWRWDFGDSGVSNQQNPSRLYKWAGVYTVSLRVEFANGCEVTQTKTNYIKNKAHKADFEVSDSSGCLPLVVDFTNLSTSFFGIKSYFWNFGDGKTSTQTNPSYTYNKVGKYAPKLIIVDSAGCIDSLQFDSIAVGDKANPDFFADPTQGCKQDMRHVKFTNTTNLNVLTVDSFIWEVGQTKYTKGNTPLFVDYKDHKFKTSPDSIDARLISVVNGCYDTMEKKKYLVFFPPDVKVSYFIDNCKLDTIVFTDHSLGADVINWRLDGVPIVEKNSFKRFLTPGKHKLWVEGTNNGNGCKDTQEYEIDILYPLVADIGLTKKGVCANDSITFFSRNLNASRGPLFTFNFTWTINGTPASNSNSFVRLFPDTGRFDIGLTIVDAFGCKATDIDSDAVAMQKNGIEAKVVPDRGCFPLTSQLIYNAPQGAIKNAKWLVNGNLINVIATDTAEYTFKDLINGMNVLGLEVELQAEDTSGCIISKKNRVIISSVTAQFANSSRFNCNNTVLSFFNSSPALMPFGSVTFDWTLDDTLSFTAPSNKYTFTQSGAHNFELIVSDTAMGCYDTVKEVINVRVRKLQAGFTVDKDQTTCPPLATTFSDASTVENTTISDVVWDFGDGSNSIIKSPVKTFFYPGDYDVYYKISNSSGCSDSILLPGKIKIGGPRGTPNIDKDRGCAPITVNFKALNTNTDSIKWDFGDGVITTGNNLANSYSRPGTYQPYMVLEDTAGCTVFYPTKPIFVYPSPVPLFTDSGKCVYNNFKFINQTDTQVPATFVWRFANGDTVAGFNAQHKFTTTGTHNITLEATSINGCTGSKTQSIEIMPLNADFELTSIAACIDNSISTIDKSTSGTGIQNWLWHLGDGRTANGLSPILEYKTAGTYNVSLIVTDSNGCLDTAVNPQKVTVYDTIPPPVPLAYRVTVEPDNSIRFDFAVYPRPDFGNYIIYKAIAGQPLQIYKYINALNDTVFIDNSVNPDNNSYTYKVVNQSICDRFSSERNSRAHTSILLKGTSDTNATHLFWSAYDGWDKVETYHIYRKEPRKTNFEKIGFVAGTQTTYTDSSAFCDVVYKYYVFAEEDTLSLYHQFSRSNTIALRPLHKETVVPGTIIRATVEDDKNILVEFAPPTAPVTPIELFTLEKSSNGVNYKAVYSTPNCCPSYLDKDVKVHQQSYYYRIKCTDYCADISAPSNIGKSILLGTGINADDNITVDWSAYQHWDDGVKKYELEIQTGSGGFVNAGVNNLTDKDTNYIDTEGDYNYFPKICYRVKATSFNGVISYSNTDCEKGRSSLFVPNAFTPNGDSHNNTFVVVGSYIKTYKIQIFNRYGEKLFTGYSLEDTWDGTFKGEAVQDDAYIYIINAEGIDNKRYNLHGNVTVLN